MSSVPVTNSSFSVLLFTFELLTCINWSAPPGWTFWRPISSIPVTSSYPSLPWSAVSKYCRSRTCISCWKPLESFLVFWSDALGIWTNMFACPRFPASYCGFLAPVGLGYSDNSCRWSWSKSSWSALATCISCTTPKSVSLFYLCTKFLSSIARCSWSENSSWTFSSFS